MPELRKLQKSLPVNLTNDEKLAAAAEMGNESQLYQEALDRKKEVTKSLQADVEGHRAAMQRLGSLIANGYEYRTVNCELVIDLDLDLVIVTRIDTGEIIEKRPVRPDEAQQELL